MNFCMLNSIEHEISTAHRNDNATKIKTFLAFKISDMVFIMLINVEMPTIVGLLPFMSMIRWLDFGDLDFIFKVTAAL